MVLPMMGVRPRPPPTSTSKPTPPSGPCFMCRPMSCTSEAGAIRWRTRNRDLELARQVVELRMQRRPLADDFAVRPRILDLVRCDTGEMIGRGVADAVAAGLDGMHLDGGEIGQHVGHVFELRPVVLQVLARGEVGVVAVVLACQMREHAQLLARQQAVGNRDAQHRRMLLDVQAVAQAQGAEFILGQRAFEEAARLVAELRDPLGHDGGVDFVVSVHGAAL